MAHILGIDDWAGNLFTDLNAVEGVQFAFIRLAQMGRGLDTQFNTHWHEAEIKEWKRAPYFVIDPTYSITAHIKFIQENSPTEEECSLPFVPDIELDRGKNKTWLTNYMRDLLIAIKEIRSKILIYSGAWWWDVKISDNDWQAQYDFWLAQYPLAKYPRIFSTWADLKVYYPSGWTRPLRSGGRAAVWQWSGDKFIMTGIGGPIDLNFIPETIWEEWTGPARPTIEQRITALEERVAALEAKQ